MPHRLLKAFKQVYQTPAARKFVGDFAEGTLFNGFNQVALGENASAPPSTTPGALTSDLMFAAAAAMGKDNKTAMPAALSQSRLHAATQLRSAISPTDIAALGAGKMLPIRDLQYLHGKGVLNPMAVSMFATPKYPKAQ